MIWYDILIYSIGGALLLLMSLGIVISSLAPSLDRWSRRYLITLFSLQLGGVISCFIDALIYENAGMAVLERIVYLIGFVGMLPLIAMPTVLLLHYYKENPKKSPLCMAVLALSVVYLGLLIAAQFGKAVYYVTPDGNFIRGPYFPFLILPLALITLLNAISAIIKHKKIAKPYFIALMVYLPPLAGTLIAHMFLFFEFFILLVIGVWGIAILNLILQENMDNHIRQQKEIADQKASILMLQMRPHFIYNTMTSIYYLCDQDPAKAKQVTLDFTTYLRKNFAGIASGNTVPFVDELEHTRAYLAVEQAQFEDVLFVNFNTPHTLFRLPPLTLQPIVENAVKHGMSESKTPIHVSVTTEKTDKANLIIVEDDGPGYKPADDNEPHIALNNIRQRLEMMCKGTLEIMPREGGGTLVKVTIPLN